MPAAANTSWFPTFRRAANYPVPLPSWWPWHTTAAQRQILLRLIAVALEENLPLMPLLEQWAHDERGVQRQRVLRLVRLLKAGQSLPDALEATPGVLSDQQVLAIRFDAQSGTCTAALRAMIVDLPDLKTTASTRLDRSLTYLSVVVPIGLMFVAFTQIKIVPVLVVMFTHFGGQRPRVLQWSIDFTTILLNYWWVAALAFIGLLLSVFSTRTGRLLRYSLFGRLFQPLRELQTTDVLQKISVALDAGRPVAGALSTLARYHFAPPVRHKLLFVRNEVEQGVDVWQSMVAADLLVPADVRLLKTAERIGNEAWAFRQIVDVKKRRTRRRFERLGELLLPAMVLCLAAFVLFQMLTIFQPLVNLIEGNL